MKKVLFVVAFALALASCKNEAQNTEAVEVDSTEVVVDSTAVEAVEAPAVEVTEEVAQ